MAGKTDDASDGPKETGPEAEKIADYLRTHPGFLADYPDLVTVLAPPVREADDNVVDLQSYMIGDRWRDVEAGINAGCKTIFIDYGYSERQPESYDLAVSCLLEAAQKILLLEAGNEDS